jgi:hypothetical protein
MFLVVIFGTIGWQAWSSCADLGRELSNGAAELPPPVKTKPVEPQPRQYEPGVPSNFCEVYWPEIRSHCLWAELPPQTCTPAKEPRGKIDAKALARLRPGWFVSGGSGGGPEWFVRDDGTVLAATVSAIKACPALVTVASFLAEKPKRAKKRHGI